MSKRLQVLIPDDELTEIQRLARREHLKVGEWVCRTLLEARLRQPVNDSTAKLKAVRRAAEHSFPIADIGQLLREIERGYES